MMAPNHHFEVNSLTMEPVSRTYQYRKIMKPMLERKRRARINKCLEELKDLMTDTLQADGENISKLEKADILELTVRHLHRLRETNALFMRLDPVNVDKFWAGFHHCAAEVSHFLTKYDHNLNTDLLKHISAVVTNVSATHCQRFPNLHPGILYTLQSSASVANTPVRSVVKEEKINSSSSNNEVWRPW